MAQEIQNVALDATLNYIKTNGKKVHVCDQMPTTFAQATNTYSLGYTPTISFTGPTSITDGRKITVGATNNGTITKAGTTAYAAVVSETELLAVKKLTGSSVQALIVGNPLITDAFDLQITSIAPA
ncbi:MAG: hypothetical protein ACOX8S_12470 [Christensenellales bacterium]|jgi:hypothetical protein